MTSVTSTETLSQSTPDIDALRATIQGAIIVPGAEEYETARLVHNFVYNHRPAVVVRPANATDVAETIRFARANGLSIAVRSGAHSFAGFGSTDDGLVIDLSAMRAVTVDAANKTAVVQCAATSAEIAAVAGEHGLALTTGDVASVGIGGLATGGGIGYMVRKHGLTIDHLLSAQVVTADGRILRASPGENQDLFWAIRGGGGNFGIVTEFEFRLVDAPLVYGGAIALPPTRENLRAYLDYASNAPEELTTIAALMYTPPAPFVPEEKIGAPALVVLVCYTGDLEEGARVVQPLMEIAEPIAAMAAPMPYAAIFAFTEVAASRHGCSTRSLFTNEFPDDVLDAMIAHQPKGPSPISMVQIRVLGGAMARVPADATAFAHRDAKFIVAAVGAWLDPSEDAQQHIDWTMELWEQIKHIENGVYGNFLEAEGSERAAASYGSNLDRLAEIKARYDPDNVFCINQNIVPAR